MLASTSGKVAMEVVLPNDKFAQKKSKIRVEMFAINIFLIKLYCSLCEGNATLLATSM